MKCIEGYWKAIRREPDGTFDVEGQRLAGRTQCQCGATIELWQDIDEYNTYTGKVTLGGWGPGLGVCENCGLLFVDGWERMEVYKLKEAAG